MDPLSLDLRKRVVTAIRETELSCRAAARNFKISDASAICWAHAMRERGSFGPLLMGGDTRSRRVEVRADVDFRIRLTRFSTFAMIRLARRKPKRAWPLPSDWQVRAWWKNGSI